MRFDDHDAFPIYEALWLQAKPAIHANRLDLDVHALSKEADRRRGITVVARLAPETQVRVARFIASLQAIEADQYYPRMDELHITVLAPFSAATEHADAFARLEAYRLAVGDALRKAPAFSVAFRGVTASTGVVMIQGFALDPALAEIRERLRRSLRHAGLADGLDTRYRLRTAHLSIARFVAPLSHPQRTGEFLQANRETDFGTMAVESVELITNDWYLSNDRTTRLDTHPLGR